ncbi:CHAP domain-containing protein [Ideonella sp. 4Y11]|uniref:CHAP domain-containing protein n=1 Tax=Ideonella aquatica TaxID=2824119 RepID=A0A941BR39_9BURK|nr:CHAP domain-containing protein [Ideonella aquatica]MBQ0959895.1 CHAP domain-containing protein [Ideonella aquatica]
MPTVSADHLVTRARSAQQLPTLYFLGQGGRDPASPTPHGQDQIDLGRGEGEQYNKAREMAHQLGIDPWTLGPMPACDCSGLVWWILGEARGHRNTDWMHQDARHKQQRMRVVSTGRDLVGRPGDLLVYGSNPGADYGHVALITEVLAAPGQDGPASRMIHCAVDNHRLPAPPGARVHSGIAETGVEVFRQFNSPANAEWSSLVCRPWLLY